MLNWLKKIIGIGAAKKFDSALHPYEAFTDLCKQLEKEGITSSKFGKLSRLRYEFGLFYDTLDKHNMHDALEELSKFTHLLEDLTQDIKSHGLMTPTIDRILHQLKDLSAEIVKEYINRPDAE